MSRRREMFEIYGVEHCIAGRQGNQKWHIDRVHLRIAMYFRSALSLLIILVRLHSFETNLLINRKFFRSPSLASWVRKSDVWYHVVGRIIEFLRLLYHMCWLRNAAGKAGSAAGPLSKLHLKRECRPELMRFQPCAQGGTATILPVLTESMGGWVC